MNIKLKNLEALVKHINEAVGNSDRKTIGHYYVDKACGGWTLVQTMNDGCGINNITRRYCSKLELYDQLLAFLAGVKAAQNKSPSGY